MRGSNVFRNASPNLVLGACCALLALLALFVWIPLDTETGLVELTRRHLVIGDALAPTVAAGFVLLGGLLLALGERRAGDQHVFKRDQVVFILGVAAVSITGLLVMRHAGPALVGIVNLSGGEPLEYRLLRATPGWRHVGFALGGVVLVGGLVSLVERRISFRAMLTGIIAALVLIAVFDLPFEDLLLPPNGDV